MLGAQTVKTRRAGREPADSGGIQEAVGHAGGCDHRPRDRLLQGAARGSRRARGSLPANGSGQKRHSLYPKVGVPTTTAKGQNSAVPRLRTCCRSPAIQHTGKSPSCPSFVHPCTPPANTPRACKQRLRGKAKVRAPLLAFQQLSPTDLKGTACVQTIMQGSKREGWGSWVSP